MDDVDHAQTGVDGLMQVAAQGLTAVSRLSQRRPAPFDRAVEHVQCHCTQQQLPVREVAVERPGTDASSHGDRVHGWLPADLQEQLDRSVDEPSPVPSNVGSHRQASRSRGPIGDKRSRIRR